MQQVDILKMDVSQKKGSRVKDCVAEEKPLHLFLNGKSYATIFCTPSNLKELAVGHLIAEGIAKSIDEIQKVEVEEGVCRIKFSPTIDLQKRLQLQKHYERVILSACGSKGFFNPTLRIPRVKNELTVEAQMVLNCVSRLNTMAETFRKTGGVHAAAIFKADGNCVAFAEDIGRHNAVDKVLGMALIAKRDLGDCFITLTGRLTGDIVMKSARMKMPILASIAAAIDSGIAVARKANLTLIGFARGHRMNIYCAPERIVL